MENILLNTKKRQLPLALLRSGVASVLAVLSVISSMGSMQLAAGEEPGTFSGAQKSTQLVLISYDSSKDNHEQLLKLTTYSSQPVQPHKLRRSPSPIKGALNLKIEHSELAKRNNLDSLALKPWAPGRGSLGIKVEVTW
jgi:hypothetical protein